MSSIPKIIIGIVSLLVVALIAIGITAFIIFDPDDYRDELSEVVFDQTGRSLVIEKELAINVLPCCSVSVGGVRLSNPAGFAAGDFLAVDSVRLGLRLWPLITSQEIIVDNIRIDGLQLNLIRQDDGSMNWDFASSDTDTEPTGEDTGKPDAAGSGFSIQGIDVQNSTLKFVDGSGEYHIDNLSVESGSIEAGQAFDLGISFMAKDVTTGTQAETSIDTTIHLSKDFSSITLSDVTSDITLSGGDLPGGKLKFSSRTTSFDYDTNTGIGEFSNQKVSISGVGVSAELNSEGKFSDSDLSINGTLEIQPFAPREVIAQLGSPPIETADPKALQQLSASGGWSVSNEAIAINAIRIRLDETNISGDATVRLDDTQAIEFNLDLDAIDLDRYLAPSEASPNSSEQSSGASGNKDELPVEMLRELDLQGTVRVGTLTVNKALLQNLRATIQAKDGLLRIDPAIADLYSGKYRGNVTLDVTGKKPKIQFKQSINAIQAGSLLADITDATNLEGLLKVSISGRSRGNTSQQMIDKLAANLSLDLADGVYKGADLWYEIRKAKAKLKGKALPPPPDREETPISALEFTGRVADGLLTSENLTLDIPFIQIGGQGLFNLVNQNIDYRLNARVTGKPDFRDGEDLSDLENVVIPLQISGNAGDPKFTIDLAELGKNAAVQKFQDRLLKKLDSDDAKSADGENQEESGKDALKRQLRNLFD